MRYFAELAYNGTRYYGWQRQPGQDSVQETLEQALSTILGVELEVTGCGRTDTGVHASQYYLHFDFDGAFPRAFTRRINKFLPPDIAIYRIFPVAPEAHARYDAIRRAYQYHITFRKHPFAIETAYHFPFPNRPDLSRLREAATLLLQYEDFYPFCKSKTDVQTMKCQLYRAEWEERSPDRLVFHIAANRFLRGMVRLIVGMSLNVAMGKIPLETVRQALDQQIRLKRSWSAPPEGLFLSEVQYPFVN